MYIKKFKKSSFYFRIISNFKIDIKNKYDKIEKNGELNDKFRSAN